MPIKYPDVSKDFPKLIRTLALLGERGQEFDFWDHLTMGIYNNYNKPEKKIESYFKGEMRWFHGDRPLPTCPELDGDWSLIKDIYVERTTGTKYRVKIDALLNGPLKEYATNPKLPVLFEIKTILV